MVARRKRASAIAAYIYISRRILTRHENQRALTKCLNGGGFSAASRPPSLLKMTVCANLSCSLKGRVGRCPEQLQSRLVKYGQSDLFLSLAAPRLGAALQVQKVDAMSDPSLLAPIRPFLLRSSTTRDWVARGNLRDWSPLAI